MKKMLVLVLVAVTVLSMTAVFASAAPSLPTEWEGNTLDWDYMKKNVMMAEYGQHIFLQLIYSIDVNCPEWAYTEVGCPCPDCSTWYGTDGTDGYFALNTTMQDLDGGGIYQLQNSYNIWDACAEVEATLSELTEAQKASASEEIAYYDLLKDKCLELLGNCNGVYTDGVTQDCTCPAALYVADMVRDAHTKIIAAAGSPATSDAAPVVAVFAGFAALAAVAVVLKKKVA